MDNVSDFPHVIAAANYYIYSEENNYGRPQLSGVGKHLIMRMLITVMTGLNGEIIMMTTMLQLLLMMRVMMTTTTTTLLTIIMPSSILSPFTLDLLLAYVLNFQIVYNFMLIESVCHN